MHPSADTTLNITIIGAGFSGLATVTQLAKKFSDAANANKTKQYYLNIILVDPREKIGGYT